MNEKCSSRAEFEPVPFRPQDQECKRVHNYA